MIQYPRFKVEKQRPVLALLVMSVFMAFFAPPGAKGQPALLDRDWRTDYSKTTINLSELSVNLPRDAIRSIDNPSFVSIDDAGKWLNKREPVVLVSVAGKGRAYPLQILTWHEIVNDEFEGVPLVVTFCPLCYSALVFERKIEGDTYEFGVSGMLRHSDLVMFDRQTHSLFQQLNGEGIVGVMAGQKLTSVAAQIISFEEFQSAFPSGEVLSRITGHVRRYGQNPYPGYDDIDEKPWAFTGKEDGRLPPMERVVAVDLDGMAKAYPHSRTRAERVINDTLAGKEIVILHSKSGAVSALDKANIARSRVLGSTGVFRRRLGDFILTFEKKRDHFVDVETGSEWDVTGLSIGGPLTGERLTPIPHSDVFSFAWFVVWPEGVLYQ